MPQIDSWLRFYSHQWINKDCLQTRNVKVDARVITFSLLCVWNIFLALASKGILCALEKVSRLADVVGFTFAMWHIISSLLCKYILPEVSVINLFKHLRIFLVRQGNSSEFLGLSKWVKRFEGKFSICSNKRQLARTCRGEDPKSSKISRGQRKLRNLQLLWLLCLSFNHKKIWYFDF